MNNLIEKVEIWAEDKGLHNADPTKQALKFFEEAGEVASAMARSQEAELKDAIGDTIVTLIILAMQSGTSVEECLQIAYDEIKGRTGKMINGTFVKSEDIQQAIEDADQCEMWG